MGGEHIGVDVPSVVSVGEGLAIRAHAETGDPTLALQAVVRREDGVIVGEPQLLDSDGEGGYDTRFSGLAVGKYVFLRAGVSSPQNADTLDGLLIRLLACQCLE